MENDTNNIGEAALTKQDPLGLENFGKSISKLTRLRDEQNSKDAPSRFAICVDGLADAYDIVATKYELLRDRYSLLKRSNAQLHDELVWLRDQFDDLCSLAPDDLQNKLNAKYSEKTSFSNKLDSR